MSKIIDEIRAKRTLDLVKQLPKIRCQHHGVQPILGQCQGCAQAMLNEIATYKKAMGEARDHLLSAAKDCERFAKKLELYEAAIEEISEVTHKQYCIDGLHGALPEGEHHSACQYLRDLKEEIENADAAATDGSTARVEGNSADVPPVSGDRVDGDTASGSGSDLEQQGVANVSGEEVPKETDHN